MKQQNLATLFVIAGAFGWALRDLVSKDLDEGTPVWLTLAASSGGGLVINTAVLACKQCAGFGCSEKLPFRTQLWLATRAVGKFVGLLLNLMALKRLDLAISSMIQCTSPMFIVPLGAVLLSERVKPLAVVCILIALGGMVLDVQPWGASSAAAGGSPVFGLACALGSSVAIALSYTSLRGLASLPPTTTLMALYGFCLTAGFLGCVVEGMEPPSGWMMAHFAALSVVSYISDWLMTEGYALATEGAGSVAIYKFLTPVFALAFDVAVYHKIPDALNLAGMLLVVGASAAMVRVQAAGKEEAHVATENGVPAKRKDAKRPGEGDVESGLSEASTNSGEVQAAEAEPESEHS